MCVGGGGVGGVLTWGYLWSETSNTVQMTNDSLGYNDSNFHSVYIFADI